METSVIIFGSTGDLARTKLFQALATILQEHPEHVLRVIAVGRKEYSSDTFYEYLAPYLKEFGDGLKSRLNYIKMDMLDPEQYHILADYLKTTESGPTQRIVYLAIPPEHYAQVLSNIGVSGIAREDGGPWRRIVVEKPFGHNVQSAQELDQHSTEIFSESQLYRVDHYLGKETVQNILAFRFANSLFESLWNAEHIDHVQITVAEEDGIRDRGSYFDATGSFRDVFQNHILQLLAFVALEEPADMSFDAISNRKVEVLRHVQPVMDQILFGQYNGYTSEPGVHPESGTETFAMSCLEIDTDRWRGVPFYIRTGKKLQTKISEISIQFKKPTNTLFDCMREEKGANVLTFRLRPDEGIATRFNVKTPRFPYKVQPVQMEFCYGTSFKMTLPEAYELIFLDVLTGDRMHALRSDAIEESWRIVDQILSHKANQPLYTYEAGSWGPEQADVLLQKSGRYWLAHESEICNGVLLDSL